MTNNRHFAVCDRLGRRTAFGTGEHVVHGVSLELTCRLYCDGQHPRLRGAVSLQTAVSEADSSHSVPTFQAHRPESSCFRPEPVADSRMDQTKVGGCHQHRRMGLFRYSGRLQPMAIQRRQRRPR